MKSKERGVHLQLKWVYLEKLPKYLWISFPISNVIPVAEFCGKHIYICPSTLGDPPFPLRTSYHNFCSMSTHYPGQHDHYDKDHRSSGRLHLIHAAMKVMKKRYKMLHLAVQGEQIGMGRLTVVQVFEKVAKLWRHSVSPSWGLCSSSVWKRWVPWGGPVLVWEEGQYKIKNLLK